MVIIWNRDKFKIDDYRISHTSMTVNTSDKKCLKYFGDIVDKTNFLKKNDNKLLLYCEGKIFNIINPYVIKTGKDSIFFDIRDSYTIQDDQTITDIKILLLE